MSYATIIRIPSAGEYEDLAEYSNAWGGAARIWTAISDKYGIPWICADPKSRKFWDLAADPRLSDVERIVFASTFDRMLWEREHAHDLARFFREFSGTFSSKGSDHLAAWADLLEQHAGDDCIGFGLIGTSVAGDVWMVPDGEDYRRFNWDRDKETGQHLMLFAEYGRAT
jgi:hypothetical protein